MATLRLRYSLGSLLWLMVWLSLAIAPWKLVAAPFALMWTFAVLVSLPAVFPSER